MTAMAGPARPSRLAALVIRPGGVTADAAVAAAGARLAAIQERSLADIDDALVRMRAIGLRLADQPDQAALQELYPLANAVFGVAGLFGLETLGAVSYSLCELIDRLHATGAWLPATVRVHLDSLGLARHASSGSAAQRAVLDGLRRMMDNVPLVKPPAGGATGR